MLYLSQKFGYKIQMNITPSFKQVNFKKMVTIYLTSTEKIRGEGAYHYYTPSNTKSKQ